MWRTYRIPIILSLLVKLLLILFIWHNNKDLFEAGNVWDAPHYLSLAENGYETTGDPANFIVFFPLFPLVVFALKSILFMSPLMASYIVNTICLLGASVLLYRLSLFHFSQKEALWITASMLVFPTSFFFHIPYTESLFLLLTLLCFYFLQTKRFLVACICAGLAAATRSTGIALIPAIVVELVLNNQTLIRKKPLVVFLGLATAVSGFVVYLGINWFLFNDPFHFVLVQQTNWHHSFSPTLKGLWGAVESIGWRTGTEQMMLGYAQIAAFVLAVTGGVASLFFLPACYSMYYWITLVMSAGISFWISMPRYILVLFPLFMMMGKLASRWFVFRLVWFPVSVALLYVFFSTFINYGPVF